MDIPTLKGEPRTKSGTRVARRVRQSGRLPAVVYGHGEPPESVSLDGHDVLVALAHGARTLAVDLGGATKQFLIKDVQYDHLAAHPIHLDLMRVDLTERVQVSVGIELKGTPKGVSEGGILEQLMTSIEVECVVTDIPETLHPVVTHLHVGDSLLVKDLEFPASVTPLAGPEERVAMVRTMAAAPVEAEATAEGAEPATAEPEIISRGKKVDEGEEGS